ncbi:MAG: c-type cytochrome [Betaproteobacteria bacterium]
MKRFAVLVICLSAAAASPGLAQPPGAPPQPPPKNLQVLPKDMSRQDVVARMQLIAAGLGVRCGYCHVDDEPGRENDFATDEKPAKNKARFMMRMTADLNAKLASGLGKPAGELTTIQCATCHRGVAIPKQITDILTETTASKGIDAALSQYRDLRKQYYGGQSYDFSEGALLLFARREAFAKRTDEALRYLQLNLEYYPQSARTYLVMAQVQNMKGDKEGAIRSAEKALSIEPDNAMARRLLERLRTPGQ